MMGNIRLNRTVMLEGQSKLLLAYSYVIENSQTARMFKFQSQSAPAPQTRGQV